MPLIFVISKIILLREHYVAYSHPELRKDSLLNQTISMYHAMKLWGVCVCVLGLGAIKQQNTRLWCFVFCLILGVPPYPWITLHHPAGLFSCILGTSDRSEFPMDLILRCWEEAGWDIISLVPSYPREAAALPGKVGLNTYCPVPVQYLSGRGNSEGSEVIVFPVALVMPHHLIHTGLCTWWRWEGRDAICPGRLNVYIWLAPEAPRTPTLSDPP